MNLLETTKTSKKLSKLERKWYKEYIAIGCIDATQALTNVYNKSKKPFKPDSIRSMASQIKRSVFSKLNISFDDLMEEMGLSEGKLLEVGMEGLKATRPIFVKGVPQAVADYQARHRYWQDFMKMKNILKDKLELEGDVKGGIQVNLQVNNGFIARPIEVNASSGGGYAEQPPEIQDLDLAQTKQENDNSDTRTTEAGTS